VALPEKIDTMGSCIVLKCLIKFFGCKNMKKNVACNKKCINFAAEKTSSLKT